MQPNPTTSGISYDNDDDDSSNQNGYKCYCPSKKLFASFDVTYLPFEEKSFFTNSTLQEENLDEHRLWDYFFHPSDLVPLPGTSHLETYLSEASSKIIVHKLPHPTPDPNSSIMPSTKGNRKRGILTQT